MEKFRELSVGVIFLAFSVFIYALSYQIHMTKADPIGPQFFPRLVAMLIGVLAIISIVRSAYQIRERNRNPRNTDAIEKTKAAENQPNYSFYFTILLLIAYMVLIAKVGFIVLSIIYLFIQIYLISPKEDLQKKNLMINGIVAVVIPIALYYLFYHAFGIFLPPGILD